MGTPLKDWDIQINYGIKTGCNDAFIITTKKREEILGNCRTADERRRTEELIRPILRGRDIKRYGYEWAGLWLINTHNGVRGKMERIQIEDYPAVKAHLDKYWDKISERADKGDSPYNLRNCAYLEDFSRPKIIYPEITKYMPFYYDNRGFLQNNKTFMLIGEHVAFMAAFFNSPLFRFCFKETFPQLSESGRELRKVFFEQIPVIRVSDDMNAKFEELVTALQAEYSHEKVKTINNLLYDLYGLTSQEREVIEHSDIA